MKIDIENFYPCVDGLEWYTLQKTSIEAWNSCHRGDWMLWIAERLGVDRKKLILIGAKCANTVRHLMKDKRSRNAVDTLIAYGEGRATEEEFEKVREEAYDAYNAASTAYASAAAAFYAAGKSQEAKKANKLETANICREILTEDIIEILKT